MVVVVCVTKWCSLLLLCGPLARTLQKRMRVAKDTACENATKATVCKKGTVYNVAVAWVTCSKGGSLWSAAITLKFSGGTRLIRKISNRSCAALSNQFWVFLSLKNIAFQIQSDPLIPDPAIPDIRYIGRAEKVPASQSHLAITDKLKFWWFRYNGNLVSRVRYSEGRL